MAAKKLSKAAEIERKLDDVRGALETLHTLGTTADHVDKTRDMRPRYWLSRNAPKVLSNGTKAYHYPLVDRIFYDPKAAVRACRKLRRRYPDAIVVQEQPV